MDVSAKSDDEYVDSVDAKSTDGWSDLCKSDYAKVIFCDLYHHSEVGMVGCQFQITDNVHEDPSDLVGLFRVGHDNLDQCLASKTLSETECEEDGKLIRCAFKYDELPNMEHGFYQFLYVTRDKEVCGASMPFEVKRVGRGEGSSDEEVFAEKAEEEDFLMVRFGLERKHEVLKAENTVLQQKHEALQLTNGTLVQEIGILEDKNRCLVESNEMQEETIDALQKDNTKMQDMLVYLENQIKGQAGEIDRLKSNNLQAQAGFAHEQETWKKLEVSQERRFLDLQKQNNALISQMNEKITDVRERENQIKNLQVEMGNMAANYKSRIADLHHKFQEGCQRYDAVVAQQMNLSLSNNNLSEECTGLKRCLKEQEFRMQRLRYELENPCMGTQATEEKRLLLEQVEDGKFMIKALEDSKQLAMKEMSDLSELLLQRTKALDSAKNENISLQKKIQSAILELNKLKDEATQDSTLKNDLQENMEKMKKEIVELKCENLAFKVEHGKQDIAVKLQSPKLHNVTFNCELEKASTSKSGGPKDDIQRFKPNSDPIIQRLEHVIALLYPYFTSEYQKFISSVVEKAYDVTDINLHDYTEIQPADQEKLHTIREGLLEARGHESTNTKKLWQMWDFLKEEKLLFKDKCSVLKELETQRIKCFRTFTARVVEMLHYLPEEYLNLTQKLDGEDLSLISRLNKKMCLREKGADSEGNQSSDADSTFGKHSDLKKELSEIDRITKVMANNILDGLMARSNSEEGYISIPFVIFSDCMNRMFKAQYQVEIMFEYLDKEHNRFLEASDKVGDLECRCMQWDEVITDLKSRCAELQGALTQKESEVEELKQESVQNCAVIAYLEKEKESLCKRELEFAKEKSYEDSLRESSARLLEAKRLYEKQYLHIRKLEKSLKKAKSALSKGIEDSEDPVCKAFCNEDSEDPLCNSFCERFSQNNSDSDTGERVLLNLASSNEENKKKISTLPMTITASSIMMVKNVKEKREIPSGSSREYVDTYARLHNIPLKYDTKVVKDGENHTAYLSNVSVGEKEYPRNPQLAASAEEAEELAATTAATDIKDSTAFYVYSAPSREASTSSNSASEHETASPFTQVKRELPSLQKMIIENLNNWTRSIKPKSTDPKDDRVSYSIPCSICEKPIVITSDSTLPMLEHVERQHRMHMCPICGQMFEASFPQKYLFYHVNGHFKTE